MDNSKSFTTYNKIAADGFLNSDAIFFIFCFFHYSSGPIVVQGELYKVMARHEQGRFKRMSTKRMVYIRYCTIPYSKASTAVAVARCSGNWFNNRTEDEKKDGQREGLRKSIRQKGKM